MEKTSLSDRCKSIILGSLLGDGSLKIHKGYKNAQFSFRHSAKYEEYFNWKAGELSEISSECSVWKQRDKNAYGKDKIRYQSKALLELTKLYHLTQKRNKLRIRRKWLNQLTPLSLCVWWMDDGSLVSDTRQGVLCTDGFLYDDLLIVVKYFDKVWKLQWKIGKVSKTGPRSNQFRLWLRSSEELKKFLRIILPHLPVSSMIPKFLMLYKDPQLQERWISEMCMLSKFNRKEIVTCMDERKKNLTLFRK